MSKKALIPLYILNIVLIAIILYFLYFGFYHWSTEFTWLGPDEHSLTIRKDFVAIVYLATFISIVLAVISKKITWILQVVGIILVSVFWKSDFLQKTLFVNQVCSTARESRTVESFIIENETVIQDKVKLINELMKDSVGKTDGYKLVASSNELEHYHVAVGLKGNSYKVSGIEFYNNKVKKIGLYIEFERPVYHTYELIFYPEGFEEWESASHRASPLGTNLMVTCSRKYYFFGNKWLMYFEGFCFG